MAQASGTYEDSTARRDLVLQARMYGFGKAEASARPRRRSGRSSSTTSPTARSGRYSGGQRRRLDVALGVIHSPQVIFLDEPTAGLDPPSRVRMWQESAGCATRA